MKRSRSRVKLALVSLALLSIVAVLVLWPQHSPPSAARQRSDTVTAEVPLPPARVDYRRLDARIRLLMQDKEMVGLAIGTVERGHPRFIRGYGEILAGSGQPVTPDTVFRWASLSKAVAAALATKLDEEGAISLDATMPTMGTSLTLPGDMSLVTVRDVLSHRVGLVRNAWDERLEAGEDPRMLRAQLSSLPPFCAPSSCYSYQNVAFDAAAEIVERTTGQSYEQAARAKLFRPLGMTSASVSRAGLEGSASWARPHRNGRTPAVVNDNYYHVPAAGGVNSSIKDLTRWMLAQMGQAPGVLSAKALEEMHRPRVATPPHGRRGAMDRALTDAAYGLGWRTFTYAGHHLVGHRGSVNGYSSLILFDPADGSGITLLWNSNRGIPARLQLEFFDMLYGLPPTDWLDVDSIEPPADGEPPPAGVTIAR